MLDSNSILCSGSTSNTRTMLRLLCNKKKGLQICHLNAQSLVNKMDEFRYIVEASCIDIVCVSETWFSDNMHDKLFNVNGYKVFRADRMKQNVKRSGGVAIFVKNNIPCNLIVKSPNDSSIEYVFIEIYSAESKMLVGSVYRPHRTIDFTPILNIIHDISLIYNNVVVCGDFNSNALCDDSFTSEMLALGLFLCNFCFPTHFSKFSNSLLDMFFVSDLSNKLLYDQLSCSAFSKHDLIFLCYNFQVKTTKVPLSFSFRDFKCINYPNLSIQIDSINWNSIYEMNSVNDQVRFLQDNILQCFLNNVPLKTKTYKNNSKPWFNSSIKKLINERNEVYNRWKRYKTVELYTNFKNLRNKATFEIRKCKLEYYKH